MTKTIFPYIAIIFLIILEITSLIFAFITRKNLKLNIRTEPTGTVNNEVPAVITIKSKNVVLFGRALVTVRNPFNSEETKQNIYFSKGLEKKDTTLSINLRTKYCGNLKVNIDKVKVYDIFRLFGFTCNISDNKRVVILPQIYDLALGAFSGNANDLDSDEYSQERPGQDVSSIFDYRDYQQGDSIHQINWKLSQKWDKLIIKELSQPIGYRVVILMDTYLSEGTSHDTQLKFINAQAEIIMSLSKSLIENQISHKIIWYSDKNLEWCTEEIVSDNDFFGAFSRILSSEHVISKEDSLTKLIFDGIPNQITHLFNVDADIHENDNSLEDISGNIKALSFTPSQDEESFAGSHIVYKCDSPETLLDKVIL